MIDKRSFKKEHIDEIKELYPTLDQALIERCIFALGLLEALIHVGLPFVFKGGTSLMLLLKNPYRLSTDIDIIVDPKVTWIQNYLDKAALIFPFVKMEKHTRKGKNKIRKEHFKFYYQSPYLGKEIFILLDVLYENHGYAKVMGREIKNEFILIENDATIVQIPSVESILGDKLTAFAPHTTGIEFEYVNNEGIKIEKTLEVIKQFIDVAKLIEEASGFSDIARSFDIIVQNEIEYRGVCIDRTDVLLDTFTMALSIATRGEIYPNEYEFLLRGIRKIQNHIYGIRLNGETAYKYAGPVMLLVAQLLTNTALVEIVAQKRITDEKYKAVNKLKKLDEQVFNMVVTALHLIQAI